MRTWRATLGTATIVALFALTASAGAAAAYTVIGATLTPGHGAPGTAVVVSELPLAVDCPTVDVWLAPVEASPAITSGDDPRLIALTGSVRFQPIGVGAGDTRPSTTLEFEVPALPAATYDTYWQCSGGGPAADSFGQGAMTFQVDPALPASDTLETTPTPASDRSTVPLLAAALAGVVWLVLSARTPTRVEARGRRGRSRGT